MTVSQPKIVQEITKADPVFSPLLLSKKILSRAKKVISHTRHLNFLTKTERAICISIIDKLSCQVPIGISVTQTQNLEAGFTYCFLQAPCGKQATLSPLHLYDPSFSFP